MVKLGLNKSKTDWDILPKGSKEKGSIYMDGYLHNSLREIKDVMKKVSCDFVILISGYPGTGKSKLASQIASLCDPTFTEERMHQNSKDFADAVVAEDKILRAHVLDEAWEGLSSSQVRGSVGKRFMNLMNTIRQKRLYIIIVLPNFFELSSGMAIFRSRWLLHCYSEKFGEVGKFAAFDREQKKDLYVHGKRDLNYSARKYTFSGVFTKGDANNFNWDRYDNIIKKKSLHDVYEQDENEVKPLHHRNKLLVLLRDKFEVSTSELSERIGMTVHHIRQIMKKEREEQERNNKN